MGPDEAPDRVLVLGCRDFSACPSQQTETRPKASDILIVTGEEQNHDPGNNEEGPRTNKRAWASGSAAIFALGSTHRLRTPVPGEGGSGRGAGAIELQVHRVNDGGEEGPAAGDGVHAGHAQVHQELVCLGRRRPREGAALQAKRQASASELATPRDTASCMLK